jgi:hypothetical protein
MGLGVSSWTAIGLEDQKGPENTGKWDTTNESAPAAREAL